MFFVIWPKSYVSFIPDFTHMVAIYMRWRDQTYKLPKLFFKGTSEFVKVKQGTCYYIDTCSNVWDFSDVKDFLGCYD